MHSTLLFTVSKDLGLVRGLEPTLTDYRVLYKYNISFLNSVNSLPINLCEQIAAHVGIEPSSDLGTQNLLPLKYDNLLYLISLE